MQFYCVSINLFTKKVFHDYCQMAQQSTDVNIGCDMEKIANH